MPAAAGGLLVGLLSLSTALALSTSNIFPVKDWTADIFAATNRNQSAISDSWSDALISGYARSERLKTVDARWLPQPMPAVDGINAKIDAFGGGANHTNGFYFCRFTIGITRIGCSGLANTPGSGLRDRVRARRDHAGAGEARCATPGVQNVAVVYTTVGRLLYRGFAA